ncbi:MAG: aldo/keto reductase, partial [Actinomycetota bacterium]|nr:aldo/keto reductase [Actinomycetota bacterium]
NFGTRIDTDAVEGLIHACLDTGVNFFDTADVYGNGASEQMLGAAVKRHRDEVVIATKFGFGDVDLGLTGGSAEWVRRAVDRSLRRLDTDWIDLFQLHRPDDDVAHSETLEAMHQLVVAGKVREIGCSNFDAEQLDTAADVATRDGYTPYRTVQNRYSLLHREPEAEVLEVCRQRDILLLPFFPLESGLLTGKVTGDGPPAGSRLAEWPEDKTERFLTDVKLRTVTRLTDWARHRGRTLLELAFSWLLMREEVPSVIAGASGPEQLIANAATAGWTLTDIELAEVDDILRTDPGPPPE